MKLKRVITLVLVSMLLWTTPVLAAPTVNLDGQQLSFDVAPAIDNGRTLVPLRAIFEAMGATVQWDQDTQTATAIKGNTKVVLRIGSVSPTINGKVVSLDVPAKIINGRTLAPLRFVGEAFGGTVDWNQASQLISITSGPISGTPPPADTVKVHFIDVGQADSIYIQLPGNNDILIDGGNVADGSLVTNYLKKQNVDDIELLIATHPHEDHIGGLTYILNSFSVDEILDSGLLQATEVYDYYSSAANAEDCTWVSDKFQTYTFGNTALKILTGSTTWEDTNDYSIVCLLDTGDIEFLFTGDAEKPSESILPGDVSAEILKVGHHGSTSSTSDSFLARVNPKAAIISVGADNSYGHPAATTLSKLQTASATIYRTDLNGNIVVTTNGSTYSISTQKNLPTPVAPVITPVPANPTPTPSVSTGKYVGSIKSDKYHYPTCRYAKSIKQGNHIWFASEEEALAAGYVPCGVCKP